MKKKILLTLGFLSLILGIIGSFLPLLPTTPFLLLSAFLFSKSSEKWYNWLISLPKFGDSIKNYNEKGVIKTKAKTLCFISITAVMTWIICFTKYNVLVKTIIPVTLAFVLMYVLTRPSKEYDD
jgi:uncharacterized protein